MANDTPDQPKTLYPTDDNWHPNALRLSEHYMLSHFTFSEYAERHGIDNTPPESVINNLREVAYALEEIQRGTGYYVPHILSGYRCPELNKRIGGSKNSAHMKGLAVDFCCPGYGSALKVCKLAASGILKFDQVIWEYLSWCHLSVRPGRNRSMILTKKRGQPYSIGFVE